MCIYISMSKNITQNNSSCKHDIQKRAPKGSIFSSTSAVIKMNVPKWVHDLGFRV